MKVKGQTIQGFLKGLVRDVDLLKVSAVFLGLKLKSRNMIETNVTFLGISIAKKKLSLFIVLTPRGLLKI